MTNISFSRVEMGLLATLMMESDVGNIGVESEMYQNIFHKFINAAESKRTKDSLKSKRRIFFKNNKIEFLRGMK